MAVVYSQGKQPARNETNPMSSEAPVVEPATEHVPRQYRTVAEQILNSPYLRRRLIVHKPVIDPETGVWDYHKGKEINPPGSERKKSGPRQD